MRRHIGRRFRRLDVGVRLLMEAGVVVRRVSTRIVMSTRTTVSPPVTMASPIIMAMRAGRVVTATLDEIDLRHGLEIDARHVRRINPDAAEIGGDLVRH